MEPGTESMSRFAPVAPEQVRVARALLSVSDKTGIVEFASGLADLGVEIISTGGTAGVLADAGVTVRPISDLTGFPEIMDGRVKTLHPKLYAGLLAVRDNEEHLQAAAEHQVELVDLVCVNLYPFERTAAARIIVGPPMSMFSIASLSLTCRRPTVRSNGYRFTHTRSISSTSYSSAAWRWAGESRNASRPA